MVGELSSAVRRAYELAGRVTHTEIALEALLASSRDPAAEYAPPHRFPVAPFDVAVVVPRRTPAARVVAAIAATAPGRVRNVRVFDVYEGQGIAPGHRSLALSCELLDPAGTLTPAQAESLRQDVRRALEAQGWAVRAGEVPPR